MSESGGVFSRRAGAALAIGLLAALVSVSCHDNNDTGTSPSGGSLAQVELGAPSSPVMNGAPFNVDVHVNNLGFSVLHGARVHLVFPPPLVVDDAEVTAGGGSVMFTNGVSGATVDYDFGTIDKSAQSAGTMHARGALLPNQNNLTATITAELTSEEIHPGDAVAHVNVIVQQ